MMFHEYLGLQAVHFFPDLARVLGLSAAGFALLAGSFLALLAGSFLASDSFFVS